MMTKKYNQGIAPLVNFIYYSRVSAKLNSFAAFITNMLEESAFCWIIKASMFPFDVRIDQRNRMKLYEIILNKRLP